MLSAQCGVEVVLDGFEQPVGHVLWELSERAPCEFAEFVVVHDGGISLDNTACHVQHSSVGCRVDPLAEYLLA